MFKKSLSVFLTAVFIVMALTGSAYCQASTPLSLKAGFNFVSLTVVPTMTISELQTQNTLLEDIYLYSAAAGGFLSVSEGTLTSLGAGKGYIFYMKDNGSVNISGSALATIGDIKLKTGFNLVGFSKMPETITCSQFMTRYPSIEGIYSWSPAAGSFISVVFNPSTKAIEQLDGSDPVLSLGKSYFLDVKEDVTLNYDGSTVAITGGSTPVVPPLDISQALTDISIPGFNKKALLAINVSGTATDGGTDAVGVLPESINGPAKMIMNFDTAKLGRKDRNRPDRSPMYQTGVRTRPVITENSQTYTFKVASESTGTVNDLATTKVYGTADSKCLIFLDDAVTANYNWENIGKNFDNNIYGKMINAFGEPTDIDGNKKVVILYYDMGVAERTTYGYFLSTDLDLGSTGNEMEVFYMNIKFGVTDESSTVDPLDPEMIRTLSHEFQHLINYGQRVMIKKIAGMDSWMDEGMAESAEQLVGGTPGDNRINTMKSDSSNAIRNGWPLCVWINNSGENYAMAYTFMQYCKNQSGTIREAMFKELIAHAYGDYRAVESVMKAHNTAFKDFASIMAAYRIANLVNASSGIYGYGAENSIFNFSAAAYAPTSVENISLSPGGNVYIYPSDSALSSFTPNGQGSNIRFIRINK
ncbi:MAG: Neutral metalloprotease precursor [bacterium ADurb.Bin243]|nr:MAG: Neutral metalloprotease precursor [bacterium ADurb.Bin243]